ncbi:MAG TPA: NTF2 fold immunity protein [Flavobacterium sp.]|nr:NTF2 fold immunity protein [Flavobacterium sp.]
MRKIVVIFTFIILNVTLVVAQNKRIYLGKEYAKKELDKVLVIEKGNSNIYQKDLLIKSDETAIKVVEPILFERYGQENIESQKPYEVHKIDQYYVISGTLPYGYTGGTFVAIIDETNARILYITHYK